MIKKKNVLKCKDIDPISAVAHIIAAVPKKMLAKIYNLNENNKENNNENWRNCEEFLYILGEKLQIYKSGGIPCLIKTAEHMIKDWHNGNIPYYIMPPQNMIEFNNETNLKIVNEFKPEFNINDLLNQNLNQAINVCPKPQQNTNENKNNSSNPGFVALVKTLCVFFVFFFEIARFVCILLFFVLLCVAFCGW